MPITIRDFDTMVNAILGRIVASNIGITDTSPGSVIRTIVESIVAELDIQYYQIEDIYTAMFVDEAIGEDLDKLVAILGVFRKQATQANGSVRFSRTTATTTDITIPMETLVTTRADADGNIIEFITTEQSTLTIGSTYVDVPVKAVEPGRIYISPGQITVMGTPVIGIDLVNNPSAIDGGTDTESDAELRQRAKLALQGLGKATDSALESAVRSVDGIVDVNVVDQNRGVGTVDITVVTSVMPPTQTTIDAINQAIADTKAAGIDVQVIYPTVISQDVTITTTGDVDIAGNAILDYFGTLGAGDTLIWSQLLSSIIGSYDDDTVDVTITVPSTNVTATSTETIRVGTITINGVVWNLG